MKNAKKTANAKTPATTAKTETKKIASVAKTEKPKTENTEKTPAPKLGKYGAPAQRPNRVTSGRSEFGNRKWIFRGVTVYDAKTQKFTTDATQCAKFEKSVAEGILAELLKNPEICNGRLFYAKSDNPEIALRSVWVAYKSENGMVEKAA